MSKTSTPSSTPVSVKKTKSSIKNDGAAVRAKMLTAKAKTGIVLTKSIENHPHRGICEWFMVHGLQKDHKNSLLLQAFEHALANKGRIRKGILIGSEEHAASLAGASIWRLNNPTQGKGGPGRGQGRKAKDGQTDLVRMSVNMRPDQRGIFKEAGGSVWLRRELDKLKAQAQA